MGLRVMVCPKEFTPLLAILNWEADGLVLQALLLP
jgi:hypothetical protein